MIVSAMTDVGRARTTNEDAFAIKDLASGKTIEALGKDHAIQIQERGVLLALSDGMGGAEAGEVASALVLESLQKALERSDRGEMHEQLESAVQRANRNVFFEAKMGDRQGMGATLVALFVRGDEAYIAEVGDSRGYILRKGRLRQITRDQSLVQLLVDQGVMSEEEARSSPSKNVILQAMGLAKDVRVAIARLRLRRGDRFLMCSDGVTNPISDEELQQILTASDPRTACETMIALANERGGDDNQTAIVADLDGDGLPPPDEFETVTETYEVLKRYDATYKGKAVTPEIAQGVANVVRAKAATKSPIATKGSERAKSESGTESLRKDVRTSDKSPSVGRPAPGAAAALNPDAPEPIHDPSPRAVITDRVPKMAPDEVAPASVASRGKPTLLIIAVGVLALVALIAIILVAT
ncbi:MAG: PP2C family serine/threonine-protein phosphatase [Kofleriaceae bacterium]|nr:PP2C family serine/threonine-protein phosphatase [Kofleriaceae bacterium]